MANFLYNNYKALALSGTINLVSDDVKVMLVADTYTAARNNTAKQNHTVTGDLGANEAVDSLSSYTVGGTSLAGKTITINTAANEARFDANDVSWESSTITASGAVVYVDGGTPATNYLIAYIDFESNQSSSNGTFQIVWNSEGIVNLDEA